jgi:YfiH family protein
MSGVPYDSLNLGFNTPDNPVHVSENWRRLTGFLNIDLFCVARMGQVHGVTVQRVDRGGVYPGTDGLITGASGVLLCVMVADCTPLLLFDPDNHTAAAVHCGWRSLTGGIVERTVEAMRKEFGSLAENLLAATGPSAGSCCYEVGPEVAGLLHRDAVINREGRLYGDLRADITFRLTEIGVDCANIDNNSDCSIHMDSLYFSHRRDSSSSGRMAGYIMLR